MEANNKQTQQSNPLKSKLIKNILICTILLVVVLLVFWAVNSGARGEQTTYDDLVSKIETGSVSKIEFDSKYVIAEYNDGNLYWIYNSNGVGELILENFYGIIQHRTIIFNTIIFKFI